MKNICYFILLVTFIFFIECTNSNPRAVQTWISISDTIVQDLVSENQNRVDSICTKKSDSLYKLAYDSIYAKRWQEMKYLLDSITQLPK